MPKLSIILVTWNCSHALSKCLPSLPADAQVIVADNVVGFGAKDLMADRVIVTSPPVTVPEAIACCRFGGRVSVLGLDFGGRETVPLDVNRIVFNKIDVKGVIAEPAMHFRQAIDLLKSKAVDPDLFLTDFVTFGDFAAKIRDVLERRSPSIKVCLRPN